MYTCDFVYKFEFKDKYFELMLILRRFGNKHTLESGSARIVYKIMIIL